MMESTHNEGVAVGSRMSRMSHGVGFGTMLAISCAHQLLAHHEHPCA